MHQVGRARSAVVDYLCEYIRREKPRSIATWVADDVYLHILAAARTVGTDKLKPIFLVLGEKVSYDEIRIVLAHMLGGTSGQ